MCEKLISIRLGWRGPFKLFGEDIPEIEQLTNSETARGVYQIYGSHPIYGRNVLLYIGKACDQTFRQRLIQHDLHDWTSDPCNLEIYIGRLLVDGSKDLTNEEWATLISVAEGLLIHAHCPAFNSVNIQNPPTDVAKYRVLNYGSYVQLMEEVSGERFDPAIVRKLGSVVTRYQARERDI